MDLEGVRSTLIGQIAWLPQKGIGSFITLEFGPPRLITREPIDKPNVHPLLGRRNVTVQGEWHLWIQADDWTLQSADWEGTSSDDEVVMRRCLIVLGDQRLVRLEATKAGSTFAFEYGEVLTVRPDRDPAETQWALYIRGAGSASWLNRGELVCEDEPSHRE